MMGEAEADADTVLAQLEEFIEEAEVLVKFFSLLFRGISNLLFLYGHGLNVLILRYVSIEPTTWSHSIKIV